MVSKCITRVLRCDINGCILRPRSPVSDAKDYPIKIRTFLRINSMNMAGVTQKYFTNNLQTVNYYPITNNYVPESNSRSIFLFATNINYGSWHVWRICIPVYWEYVDGRGDIRSVRVVSCS